MFLLNFKKKSQNISPIEPIILLLVFFLPGLLGQIRNIQADIFNSLFFNIYYLAGSIPQIMLLIYLISKKGSGASSRYGITRFTVKDVWKGFQYFIVIMIIILAMGAAAGLLSILFKLNIPEPPGWKVENLWMLPVVFITFLSTGYREELFFRSYMLTEFISETSSPAPVVFAVSLLFASGHLYQGIIGFAVTFIIGIFFSVIFLKNRNVHSIAIGHALYDFGVLLSGTFLMQSPLFAPFSLH